MTTVEVDRATAALETAKTLMDLGTMTERAIERALAQTKLSPAQWRILNALALDEEPLTPTALAGVLFRETHSVSGLLNRLEDRGLISRHRARRDRRVVGVKLTKDGARTWANGRELIDGVTRTMLDFADGYRVEELRDRLIPHLVEPRLIKLRQEPPHMEG